MDELIGKDYDHAVTDYFKTDADNHYTINIHDNLNEFDGAIWELQEILKDSIVHVYTWKYFNHKKTIWVGKTPQMDRQVLDAIRYKNTVRF